MFLTVSAAKQKTGRGNSLRTSTSPSTSKGSKPKSNSDNTNQKNQTSSNCNNGKYYSHLPYHPISSCGPLDNAFLEFYAELYASAVLYSDPAFQQKILYPSPYQHEYLEKFAISTAQQFQSTLPKKKEKVKGKVHHRVQIQSPVFPPSASTPIPPPTLLPPSTSKEANNNKSSSATRRQVSFSKHSPRSSNTLSQMQSTPRRRSIPKAHVVPLPRVTIQGNSSSCWSSTTEESDTTETSKDSTTVDDLNDSSDTDIKDQEQFVPTHPDDVLEVPNQFQNQAINKPDIELPL